MNAYELEVRQVADAFSFAIARWELFSFPEVRGLATSAAGDRVIVHYEGETADPTAWCRMLSAAGFPATPVGPLLETGEAA